MIEQLGGITLKSILGTELKSSTIGKKNKTALLN